MDKHFHRLCSAYPNEKPHTISTRLTGPDPTEAILRKWSIFHAEQHQRTRLGSFLAAFLFIFIVGSFFAPDKAHADFRVCNTTQNLVGVALGYRAKSGWVTEGWWHVNASSCTTLVVGPLTSRYYYLYAEDAQSGGRWDGRVNMCVAENQFKITGINDCFARGFQRSGFQEYDTGEQTSWMVQLTEENPPSSPIVTDTPSP